MKYLLIIFVLIVSQLNGQYKLDYQETPLVDVIRDIEDLYSIRFSYNSDKIKDLSFSYSAEANLEDVLDELGSQMHLEFHYLDFENILIRKKVSLEALLDTILLDEVLIVTEYITSGFDHNKEDASLILEPDEQGILPGLTEPDVMQSLQLIPGITSPDESASNLHIRGGTSDQNLVLFDNIKMYHQGHLFGSISAFNPYIIDQVKVYRSGTNPIYGDRISGIVDMKSPDYVNNQIDAGIGTNMLHSDFFVKAPLIKEKFGIILSGRRSLTDLWNSPTFQNYSNRVFQNTRIEEANSIQEEEELDIREDRFFFYDLNAKAIYKPNEKNKFSLSVLSVRNRLDYENVDEELTGSRDEMDLSNSGWSFNWRSEINRNWRMEQDLHVSSYKSDNLHLEFEEDSITQERYSRFNSIDDIGWTYRFDHFIDNDSKLILGYDFTSYQLNLNIQIEEDGIVTENEDSNEQVHSIFGTYQKRLNNWYWSAGVRLSYYNQLNSLYPEPRAYIAYEINDALKWKSSAEIKNQAISQLLSFEFNDLGFNNASWVLAEGEEIPVLNNKQLTSGILLNKNDWKVDIEAYYKEIRGLTSFTQGFNSNINEDYAEGRSNIYGVDVLIKKRIKKFRTWLAYSLSRNDFVFEDISDASFDGNFDRRHSLNFSNSYTWSKFQLSVGWFYATGLPYTLPAGINTFLNDEEEEESELLFSSQNDQRLLYYHKLDASFIYNFFLDPEKKIRARLGIAVINIYDRANELDKNFDLDETDEGEFFIVEQTDRGLGRTMNMVFRIWF